MSSICAKCIWSEAVDDLDEISIDNLKCGRITKEVPATSKRSVCAGCGRFIRSGEGHYVYDGRRWCVGCYEKRKGGRCQP